MAYTENTVRESHTRRTFLKGAAATGLMTIIASGTSRSTEAAAFAKANLQDLSDADILNFALTLEHLEAEFYKQVVSSGVLTDYSLPILTEVRDHEIAHVEFLTKALSDAGAEPVQAQESYNFEAAGDLSTEAGVLAVSEVLEETGVGAYTGAAALLDNKDFLAAAGSIEQVEARHQGAIRWLNDKNPAGSVLGPVFTVAEVQEKVAPILGS
ncbi:MAG: ferritin-like domain-containing protein [Chloroflexota bacterium]|nr:ferritin-like domain-containing protein [Chloroflexota bacterium]